MTDPTNPLTQQHRKQLEDSLVGLQTAKSLAKRLQAAGVDQTEQLKTIAEQEEVVKRTLQAFFGPGT